MNKSKSDKNDGNWHRGGYPNKVAVKHVTEPDHGVGSGVGMKGFDHLDDDSVMGSVVTRPGKPVIPFSGVHSSVVTIGGVQRPALGPDDSVFEEEIKESEDEVRENTMKKDEIKEVGSYQHEEAVAAAVSDKKRPRRPRKGGKDMHSGMELLDLDFLLSVVEDFEGQDNAGVVMRRLCFGELVRSDQRHEISSNTLKVYAMDGNGLYGKEVQCQAMLELTERTSK